MTISDRLQQIVDEMRHRALEGCTGTRESACCDPEDDRHPEDWCHQCLMGGAAQEIERAVNIDVLKTSLLDRAMWRALRERRRTDARLGTGGYM